MTERGSGRAITPAPGEAEITLQQAADLLKVSRPVLIGLIDNGTLPGRMVGKDRRLSLHDVLAYKANHRAKRFAVLAEMVAHDQEFGLL